MNISMKTVLLGSTTLLAIGAVGHHANAATDGVPIQAIILDPVDITQTRSLNFGSLTESGAGGTATVDNADGISVGGGVTSIGGTIQSGGFTVKGSTGRQIDITTPASVALTDGAAHTMAVNTFRLTAPAGGGGANDTGTAASGASIAASLTASTVAGFRLGGVLNVGAGQVAGTYTGSVTVTANYN
ncbi:MAG: DUF4402 domain-containing protein [Alphaproteobacteria bacterium]|nr:DUF4402 domain-containing protein [Alphaproteobacteria bacterium]